MGAEDAALLPPSDGADSGQAAGKFLGGLLCFPARSRVLVSSGSGGGESTPT
jgi:hypothetical protein